MRTRNPLLLLALVTVSAFSAGTALAQSVVTICPLSSAVRVRRDHYGNLLVSQRTLNRISKIPPGSSTPVLFATGFADPLGLGVDSHDNLYVANYQSADLHRVTPAGARTVFATGFSFATCVAVDDQDNVYVGEITTQNVYRVTPGGVKTLYGNANLEPESPGPNGISRLTAIAFDPSGGLWCGTYGTSSSPAPYALSIIPAGGGTGVRMPKVPQPIFDFAPTPLGFFYTAGYQSNKLGRLYLDGTMDDYAGTGVAGLLNGPATSARFNWPSGIAVDPCMNVYLADWNNNVVREVDDPLCIITPTPPHSWGRLKAIYR